MQDSTERRSLLDDGIGRPSPKIPKREAYQPRKIDGKRGVDDNVASKPPEKRARLDIFACINGLRREKEQGKKADIFVVNGYIEFFVTYINEGIASGEPDWSELHQACKCSAQVSLADSIAFILYNIGKVASMLGDHAQQMVLLPVSVVETLLRMVLNQTSTSVKAVGIFWSGLSHLVRIAPSNLDGVFNAEVLNALLKRMLESKHLNAISIVKCVYVLSLLTKAKKLPEEFNFQITPKLLDKIGELGCSATDVADIIEGLGLIAQAGKFPVGIDVQVLQTLLDKARKETFVVRISMIIYGLGLMAQAGKLSPKLNIQIISYFLEKIKHEDINSLNLINIIQGWALIVQAGFTVTLLDIETLNRPLNKLLSHNVSELDISLIFHSLGLLADKLPRGLDAQILQRFINRVIELKTTSKSITSVLYGLALMEEAKILNGKPSMQTVGKLLAQLQLENGTLLITEASQILYALTILAPHPSLDSLPCSGRQLIRLFETLISTSYLHPNSAASLIDAMVNFRVLHRELDGLFQRLLPSLALSFHQFSPKSQGLFKQSIENLRDYPEWQTALQVQLGLKEPAPIEMTAVPVVDSSVSVSPPSPEHVEPVPSAASTRRIFNQIAPPAPPPRSVGSVVKSNTQPPSLLFKAARHLSGWNDVMQNNTLFALIANKDTRKLRDLLGIKQSSHQVRGVPQENPRNSVSVLARLARDRGIANTGSNIAPPSDIDTLVGNFFKETPRELLVELFKTSEAECFKLLLEACMRHTRYQLAISNALHLLIIHIPSRQLGALVEAFEALEFYRDHTALLKLNNALLIRKLGNNSLEEVDRIIRYQDTLIQRAIKFHDKTNHYRVVPLLASALRNVKAMNYLPEESLDIDMQEGGGFSSAKETEKGVVAAASAVGMFAKSGSKGALASSSPRDILKDYQYSDADMQAILHGRLEALKNPNIYLLGQAKMGQGVAAGNRVKAVLSDFIRREDILQALINPQTDMTFVIPIESGNHWTGICIKITPDKKAEIVYFDSLTGDSSSLQQDILLDAYKELRPRGYSVSLKEFKDESRLIQFDGTSCGPFLIENIYGHLRGQNRLACWASFKGEALVKAVHNRQLTVLQESRPEYLAVLKEQVQSEAPQRQYSRY